MGREREREIGEGLVTLCVGSSVEERGLGFSSTCAVPAQYSKVSTIAQLHKDKYRD